MVRSIEEPRRGILWLGTITAGAIRVEVGPDLIGAVVSAIAGGPPEISCTTVGGRLVLASEHGAFRPVGPSARIELDPALAALPATSFLREDAGGNLWLGKRPPVVAWRQPNGSYRADPDALSDLPGSDVQAFYAEPDGVVWLGTDAGLLRWEAPAPHAAHEPPPALIRRVTARDRVLYGGAGQPGATGETILPHRLNSLLFEWAGGGTRGGLLFQARLEGEDGAFSDWSSATTRELTGLGAGRYVFRVRARERNGPAGPEASFAFRIQPPPWRSPVALFAWAILAVTGTWGVAQLRSRALRLRNRELAARVDERTRQLETAQLAAEDANRALARANARLEGLSYLDGLTGTANRRRFDEKLEVWWQLLAGSAEPLSLVLVDLDTFRVLNDTHGNQAGDDVLRRVAGLARKAARRPDDLVARIGGAQFALLLPGTPPDSASALAMALSEAISLREDGDALPPATASLGVATAFPRDGGRAVDLLSAADGALQRARASGGNISKEAT
jgi:diguanylate cyclase (GGDEF)-like protein